MRLAYDATIYDRRLLASRDNGDVSWRSLVNVWLHVCPKSITHVSS